MIIIMITGMLKRIKKANDEYTNMHSLERKKKLKSYSMYVKNYLVIVYLISQLVISY